MTQSKNLFLGMLLWVGVSGCASSRAPTIPTSVSTFLNEPISGLFLFEQPWAGQLVHSQQTVDVTTLPVPMDEPRITLNAVDVSDETWLGTAKSGFLQQSWRPQFKFVHRLPAFDELKELKTMGDFEQLILQPRKTTHLRTEGDGCAQQIEMIGSPPFPALSGWEGPKNQLHTSATWYLCSLTDSTTIEIMVIDALISSHKGEPDWQVDGFRLRRGSLQPYH